MCTPVDDISDWRPPTGISNPQSTTCVQNLADCPPGPCVVTQYINPATRPPLNNNEAMKFA